MKVVVVGNVNLDVVVLESSAARLPGDKNDVEAINLYAGGGAFNAAYSFRSLGAEVEVASTVGNDFEGRWLSDKIAAIGARATCFDQHEGFATSKAVIQVSPDGGAKVQAYRGASQNLTLACLHALLDWADLLYVAPVAGEAPAKVLEALKQTNNTQLKVFMVPSAQGLHEQQPALLALMEQADAVCMNFIEAQMYLGLTQHLPETAPNEEMYALIQKCQEQLGGKLLVTLGPAGSTFSDGEQCLYQAAHPIARICSTIGAGDAFASKFAFHFYEGRLAVPEILALSAAYSAAVLQAPGANLS